MSYNRTEDDFTILLEGATVEELQEFIDNEDKINEIICDHDKLKKIKLDKELLQAENRSIADHNISKEPMLLNLRETLAAKYEQLKEINELFLMNQAKMKSLQQNMNLETTLAVLQTTCAEIEEESEKLAEKLFCGDLPVNDFITEFKAKRTLAHMRRIKAEKMRELILEAERNSSQSSSVATPAIPPRTQAPAYPGAAPTPYPNQYPAQPRYPVNAFSQPSSQQYPSYQWN